MFLWHYDRAEYDRRYVQGIYDEPNEKMQIGTIIHRAIENPKYNWLYEFRKLGFYGKRIRNIRKIMNKIENLRAEERELSIMADLDGIKLFSIFDGFNPSTRELKEFKTTDDNDKWQQWIVDYNEQLSFYALVYKLSRHEYFTEQNLYRINYAGGTIKKFSTTRGPADIKIIKEKILRTVEQMQRAGVWEKRLSREEQGKKFNLTLNLGYAN